MTQEPDGKRKRAGNEGVQYTKRIMDEVTGRRMALEWSAERLAEEMTAVGVPWTRDAVSNLETGRRKNIAVHELLALAWVLDIADLAALLVPPSYNPEDEPSFPVAPDVMVPASAVRSWIRNGSRPLRTWVVQQDMEESIRRSVRKVWAEKGGIPGTTPDELAGQLIQGMRERRDAQDPEGESADGEG